MTFNELYMKIKKDNHNNKVFQAVVMFILTVIGIVGLLSLYVVAVQFIWNWLAPIIGLGKLTFLEIGGLLLLIKLLNPAIAIKTKRTPNDETRH